MPRSGSGFCATITSSISLRESAGLTSSRPQVNTQIPRASRWRRRKEASMLPSSHLICSSIVFPQRLWRRRAGGPPRGRKEDRRPLFNTERFLGKYHRFRGRKPGITVLSTVRQKEDPGGNPNKQGFGKSEQFLRIRPQELNTFALTPQAACAMMYSIMSQMAQEKN